MEASEQAARQGFAVTLRLVVAPLLVLAVTSCGSNEATARTADQELDPVVAADGRGDYPTAVLFGVLTLQNGCLALDGNATLWPTDTTWDGENTTVVLADGTRLAVGDTVEVGGGLVSPSVAADYSQSAAAPTRDCVDKLGTSELALISGP